MTTFTDKDQMIMAYSFDPVDKRLVGSFEYFWAVGTGLAAHSTRVEPPAIEDGMIPVFDEERQSWSLTEDHRCKVVYSIQDQSSEIVDYIGPIKDGYTLTQPDSVYESWQGDQWEDIRTEEEKTLQKLSLFAPLTRRQFKLALLENNLLTKVEQAISAIEDETLKTRIQIEYTESEKFERTNASVQYMLSVLDLNEEQVDEMWRYAMSL